MVIKENLFAFFKGFRDSFKGFKLACYLDLEANERVARAQQTPSPIHTPNRSVSRERTPFNKPANESSVRQRILYCSLLNGAIFITSILAFQCGLLPLIHLLLKCIFGGKLMESWWWIETLLSLLFQTTWVIPLFVISKLVNVFLFQDIANMTYKYTRGRPVALPSFSKTVADLIFCVVIQTLFFFQAVIVNYIPYSFLGYILSSFHMCLLYSLYAFDYKWSNMGWELHRRLAYIEKNWPYFLGFGLPLTIATQIIPNTAISGGIFAVFFPCFIISGHVAVPISTASTYHLPIFSPVVALSNALFTWTINPRTRRPIPE